MHKYHENESLDGSHFFLKSDTECIYVFQVQKTEEEYLEEYLDTYIYNTTLKNLTIFADPELKPKFLECCSLFKTLRKIVVEFAEKKDSVIKIELDKDKSRKDLILKFFKDKPKHIKGLTHVVNGNTVYYFFDSERIDSTTLISSLVKEFSDETGGTA